MGGFPQAEDCLFIAAARVSENWFSLAFYVTARRHARTRASSGVLPDQFAGQPISVP